MRILLPLIAACTTPMESAVEQQVTTYSDLEITDTLQLGPVPVESHEVFKLSKVDNTTSVQAWILSDDTGHVGIPGNNELVSLAIGNHTNFNTEEGPAKARGIEIMVNPTATGAYPVNSTAIQANAPGGWAWNSEWGAFRHVGDADFGPGRVRLGPNVGPIFLSSDGINIPRLVAGYPSASPPSPSGHQLVLKNDIPGVSIGGAIIRLDTAVSSGARGGFQVSRGSGGSLSDLNNGIGMSSGPGWPFSNSLPNETAVYAEQGPLVFGARIAPDYWKAFKLTTKNHLAFVDLAPTPTTDCFAGTSGAYQGTDDAGWIKVGSTATTCTIPFKDSKTLKPACVISAEAGAAFTYTADKDGIYLAVTPGSTYNYWCPCIGESCS